MITKNTAKPKSISTNNSLRIAIVASRYYNGLIDNMKKSCFEYLVQSGVKAENVHVFYAPGCWEIPIISQNIAKTKKFDGIVVFGIIVKGETYHYKILARECSRSIMNISLENNIPIAFEILVVENLEQAKKRTKGKNNKGIEGAKAVLEVIRSLKSSNFE